MDYILIDEKIYNLELHMSKYSYATERKIRILNESLGTDWREKHKDRSIDSLYNEIMGDTRKNLFCKIDPSTKHMVDELVEAYDVKMSELIELLVEREYEAYKHRTEDYSEDLAEQFANPTI